MRQMYSGAAQDASPIAALYDRYAHIMLNYLSRYISSREDVDDLVLDVFLAAMENQVWITWSDGEQLAWLRRVAHNKAVDHYRRTTRHPSVELEHVSSLLSEGDGNVYALDAASGTKKWTFHAGSPIESSPAVAEGMVYIADTVDGTIYALDAASGTKKWAFSTGSQVFSSPAVVGGAVYVDANNGAYALDAISGTKKWVFHARFSFASSPAVAGGLVYFGSYDGNLYALDAVSGTKKWAFHAGGPLGIGSTPAVAGGVVYVSSFSGNLYAFHLPGT